MNKPTPRLKMMGLMNIQGIGPKDVLEGHGIKLRSVNENVGKQ